MERVSHFWLMKELSVGMWGTNLSGNPVVCFGKKNKRVGMLKKKKNKRVGMLDRKSVV